ncbi:M1 family aminopeptidase [Bdellovibrionota bacterium FG-1]
MREKTVCRRCVELQSFYSMGGRRPFVVSGAMPHYAPDLPFKLEHLRLEVQVDPVAKTLEGTATQRVRVVAPGHEWLKLDQVGLQVSAVQVAGKKADFYLQGNSLRIHLGPEGGAKVGEVLEVSVQYHLHDSRRGLYFTGPDADYPGKPHQVWSQGQDEDSRYWFPSFDYPNQKATSEVIARVPQGYTAVSNGALLSKKEDGAWTEFHYKLNTPHVSYLVCLTVAQFSGWSDVGPAGLPVQYFVRPGREEDGKRAFGNTPAMIEVFAQKTNFPFPYEKYSQVAVQDFIFGGMENTSATTQTENTLHDARAHLDFSSDPLVSHELAHQWFGDLLTCRDWSHGWLNEGFATFMERIWIEAKPGEGGGWDEAKYYSYMDLKEYLDEDSGRYRRPMVCNTYVEPIDLFDAHLYQKGGLVLNLVRSLLGDELFWQSIRLYVTRHQRQSVETLDLIRAIEDTTGRNLRRVFDEWVFGAGHPEFELSYSWHEDKKTAEVVIEQKQTSGAPTLSQEGWTVHLFHLPVVVELTLDGGKKVTHRVELGEARERLFISVESKPVMVRFDPDHWIPKTIKFPRPKEMLIYQLKNDSDCMGRIQAARELIAHADREVVQALGESLVKDSFWGVQAEVAQALSEIRMDLAREALIEALGGLAQGNPKARRAVVRALGTFKDDRTAAALKPFAQSDASYFVEADAIYAWASARLRPVPVPRTTDLDEVEDFLLKQLEKSSYREVVRVYSVKALSELPGVGRGERPRALSALIDWSRRGREEDARVAAVAALGLVAKGAGEPVRAQVFEVLDHLADEPSFRLRSALVPALRTAGGAAASAILSRIHQSETDGRIRRNAQTAMDVLHSAGSTPEQVGQLKTSLEKLEEEYRKLRSLVEEVKKPTIGSSG